MPLNDTHIYSTDRPRQIIDHDGSSGDGTAPWNLVSRNGQNVTSGVYIFAVVPDSSEFPKTIGKFVIIR